MAPLSLAVLLKLRQLLLINCVAESKSKHIEKFTIRRD